jgi:hypothetical protein
MTHHLIPCHPSPWKNICENWRSIPHHLISHHLSTLKNNSRESPHAMSSFSLENNSENSSSMSYYLMTCHLRLFLWPTIINFNSLNMQVWHIISCYVIFLNWKIFLKLQVVCHTTLSGPSSAQRKWPNRTGPLKS